MIGGNAGGLAERSQLLIVEGLKSKVSVETGLLASASSLPNEALLAKSTASVLPFVI